MADEVYMESGIGAGVIMKAARQFGIIDEHILDGLTFGFQVQNLLEFDTRSVKANERAAMEHPALTSEETTR